MKASDPFVYAIAAAFLVAVALLAGWLPSRKAASVDPWSRCATNELRSSE